MKNFNQTLTEILKKDKRFIDQDEDLLKSAVIDKAWKVDHALIELLLENTEVREKFFDKVKDVLVFNITRFVDYIQDKNFLNDSWTKYKNKVGLNIKGKFLKERGEVSLVFPYKDCVLEGGMNDEETSRKEIFFNEILAQDEIDRLLDPKVLVNWKRFTKNGEEKVKSLKRDENGTIKENLIIKGNNLLALHSLKSQFTGKVKLIYIDPPYNTGNDGFKYNDNFNHSTWLTFMKNRLEVAKKLLRDDGVIFVQCDDNEQAYLKVLMDEIFKGNFLNTISIKAKVSAGASGGGEDKKIKKNIEYVHCYYNKSFVIFNDVFKETPIENYINLMKNEGKSFKYTQILLSTGNKEYLKTIKDGSGKDIKIYKHSNIKTTTVAQIAKKENLSINKIYKKYFNKIFTTTNAQTSIRQRVWDAVGMENIFYSIEYVPKSGKNKGKLITQYYTGNKKVLLIWFSDTAFIDEKGNVVKKEKYGTFWDGIDYNNLNKEGNTIFPNGKKPEQLLQRVMDMSTQKNDIVLDYHLGSGTTCAVAHKMGRQYIGIEQLDYGENDSIIRLNNVINGDQSGISKAVHWQEGGNFIYCELAKWNESFIEKIEKAKDTQALLTIWEEMKDPKRSFLNYNVDIKQQDEAMDEFKELSLEKQKEALVMLLDKNQLYVNLSEIDDEDYGVSKEDKRLSGEFYDLNS